MPIVATKTKEVLSAPLTTFTAPITRPRIMLTPSLLQQLTEECKVGGVKRYLYDQLKQFMDYRVSLGPNSDRGFYFAPNFALLYLIHKTWNDAGYLGGNFEETAYWTIARTEMMANSGSWGQNEIGTLNAIAADWIWDKLSQADKVQIAAWYGTPVTSYGGPGASLWNVGNAFTLITIVMRSILFHGSGINDAAYNTEYQAAMNYLQNEFVPGMQMSGGPDPSGPSYQVEGGFMRTFAIEAGQIASGVNFWGSCQRYAGELFRWIILSKIPGTDKIEIHQDTLDPYINLDAEYITARQSALLARRSKDGFAQLAANKYYTFCTTADNYVKSSLWTLVVWYDPTVVPISLPGANKGYLLGLLGMGHFYHRQDLVSSTSPYIRFNAGRHFWGHQHSMAGHFSIWNKGFLAIDSGAYMQYQGTTGNDYGTNYHRRSIAHNCFHVYDKDETFFESTGSNDPMANDGGQQIPKSNPSYADALDSTKTEFRPGLITALVSTNQPNFMFAKADCANAYDARSIQIRKNGSSSYTNKLSEYARYFLLIKPNWVFVFDRVVTKSAALSKVWNLHVNAEPVVTGTPTVLAGTQSDGITKYLDASAATVTSGSGRLFVKCLHPEVPVTWKIGGGQRLANGHAFWVGGINQTTNRYDPLLGSNHYWGSWLDPDGSGRPEFIAATEAGFANTPIGWGRVEFQAPDDNSTEYFLVAMYIGDTSVSAMPNVRLLETSELLGCEIPGQYTVLFPKATDSIIPTNGYTYTVSPDNRFGIHYIQTGLQFVNAAYESGVNGDGNTFTVKRGTLPPPDNTLMIARKGWPGGVMNYASRYAG